jgi:hypothetical protein
MKDTIITEGRPDARVTRLQELATARMRDPVVARRVAVLEREADSVISRASRAGLDISYQGIAPLFAETMAYSGDGSDWVISPVSPSEISVVPRSQQEVLRRIDASGIRFPVLYIAHEVPKGRAFEKLDVDLQSVRQLHPSEVPQLVGPTPPPVGATELANRLSTRADQVLTVIRRASAIAGATAMAALAAPVVLVGTAAAAISTIDPIIFGAVPAVSAREGEPAAWYVLARWDW